MLTHVQHIVAELDRATATGEDIAGLFERGDVSTKVTTIEGNEGTTDFINITIPGTDPDAPSLGVVGRLGGIGARPTKQGLVSDADGAIVALASGLKLAEMQRHGDQLIGDIHIGTHVCPDAPTIPHEPVPFMNSPVDMATMNDHEIIDSMDAILTIDATKGNRVHCERGFAITPTVKQGWIVKVSNDLLDIQERVTGQPPSTLTLSMQDITPYGNDLHHINSILQPATVTDAPVVGVATTSVNPVAGSSTGANYSPDLVTASKFVVETAKEFGRERASFYDAGEFYELQRRYGSMTDLQTLGGNS